MTSFIEVDSLSHLNSLSTPEEYKKIIWNLPELPTKEQLKTLSFSLIHDGELILRTLQDPFSRSLDFLLVGLSRPQKISSLEEQNFDYISRKTLNTAGPKSLPLSNEALIDEDSLLTEEDMVRPVNMNGCDPNALQKSEVMTRKKRACKNCTCGLAQVGASDSIQADTTLAKSSCGSVRI